MTKIALLGAGGKMGVRIARNLINSDFDLAPVEVTQEGQARLKAALALDCVDAQTVLPEADVVVMAVPDRLIGKIAHGFIEQLKSDAAVIVLDAAAPYAGLLPERADVTYFCSHPCHPHILEAHDSIEAQEDYFGGVAAPAVPPAAPPAVPGDARVLPFRRPASRHHPVSGPSAGHVAPPTEHGGVHPRRGDRDG